MKTIHDLNGRGARAVEGKAPAIVAKLRALDPHLIDAMQDPAHLRADGRVGIKAVARSLDRTVAEVRQDLATLRRLVSI
jgi:hypothetical protein